MAVAVMATYALATGVAIYRLTRLMALGVHSFAATREELAADIAMIRARL